MNGNMSVSSATFLKPVRTRTPYQRYVRAHPKAREEAEARSAFRRGQFARVILTSLSPTGEPFTSRVLDWDGMGRIVMARPVADDPHTAFIACGENVVEVLAEAPKDWSLESRFVMEQWVSFRWELDTETPPTRPVIAQLVAPHLDEGVWWVRHDYQRGCARSPRYRALHEELMQQSS